MFMGIVMKTLYLLRHAKSSWGDSTLADHDRPLNSRGRRAAPLIGAFLREQGHVPDLVLCSTATRTRETLAFLLEELGVEPAIDWDGDLYLAGPRQMLDLLGALPDTVESVLMIGHNPGTAILAEALCAEGDAAGLDLMRTKFPTAGLAIIHLEVDRWEETQGDCGRLLSFTRPSDLARDLD